MKTTIQIDAKTLERLKGYKKFPRDSYDNVLNTLLDESDEEFLSEDEIKDIKESLDQISRGQTYTIEDVAEELGIKL